MLSTEAGFTSLGFFSSPTLSATTHILTSIKHREQIRRDVIDRTIAVNSVKQSLFFVPSSKRRGLLVVRGQAVHYGFSVVIRSAFFLVLSTRATLGRDWIEYIVKDYRKSTKAGKRRKEAYRRRLVNNLEKSDLAYRSMIASSEHHVHADPIAPYVRGDPSPPNGIYDGGQGLNVNTMRCGEHANGCFCDSCTLQYLQ